MKRLIVALLVIGVLFLSAGTVLAGGDQIQDKNPRFTQSDDNEETDHHMIGHRIVND
ncbi:MAG: hypothetical protein JXQ23_07370 [Clostridia bacterium]|nr:hypothetical protein [Clostridia bacterium]